MAVPRNRRISSVRGAERRGFVAANLTHGQISEALPLIRATWPNIDLETWRNFAKTFTDQTTAGAVALIDASSALCGILVYRLEPDLHDGPIFSVPLFSAVDMHNSRAPVGALLEAAIERARDTGCRCLHIRLRPEQGAMVRSVATLGLTHAAGVYRLTLGARPSLN
jgi:hypothetical protein